MVFVLFLVLFGLKYRAGYSSGVADPGFGQPGGRGGRIDEDGGGVRGVCMTRRGCGLINRPKRVRRDQRRIRCVCHVAVGVGSAGVCTMFDLLSLTSVPVRE